MQWNKIKEKSLKDFHWKSITEIMREEQNKRNLIMNELIDRMYNKEYQKQAQKAFNKIIALLKKETLFLKFLPNFIFLKFFILEEWFEDWHYICIFTYKLSWKKFKIINDTTFIFKKELNKLKNI